MLLLAVCGIFKISLKLAHWCVVGLYLIFTAHQDFVGSGSKLSAEGVVVQAKGRGHADDLPAAAGRYTNLPQKAKDDFSFFVAATLETNCWCFLIHNTIASAKIDS